MKLINIQNGNSHLPVRYSTPMGPTSLQTNTQVQRPTGALHRS